MNIERFNACKPQVALDAVKNYPEYEIQIKYGFNWHGTSGPKRNQTIEDVKKLLDWACTQDVTINHDEEYIYVNGFCISDMF